MLKTLSYLAGGIGGVLILGILANALYDLSRFSIIATLNAVSEVGWAWILTTTLLIAVIFILALVSWSLNESWSMANRLTELDDSLLRLLPSIVSGPDLHERVRRVLEEFLRDCAAIFGKDLQRAILLTPSGDELVPLAGFEMSERTMQTRRFYVGSEDSSKVIGTAGRAYHERRLRVVNLRRTNGRWVADDSDYAVFDHDRPHPPYVTFAAVPLLWGNECLGVICFDSNTPRIFEAQRTQDLLYALGRRAAATIMLYKRLKNSDS